MNLVRSPPGSFQPRGSFQEHPIDAANFLVTLQQPAIKRAAAS